MAFCDHTTEGGGWTVILNRDSTVETLENFDRNFEDYENGFGDENSEYFLGLQTIHQLTTLNPTKLRIEMELYNSTKFVVKYSTFNVGSKSDGYDLSLDGFESEIPWVLNDFGKFKQIGKKFTTKDEDQDSWVGDNNCAKDFKGCWWYDKCFGVKLTGNHYEGTHESGMGIHWKSITGIKISFTKVSMKIKTKN